MGTVRIFVMKILKKTFSGVSFQEALKYVQ